MNVKFQNGFNVIESRNKSLTIYKLIEHGGYLLSDVQAKRLFEIPNTNMGMKAILHYLNAITVKAPTFLIVQNADEFHQDIPFCIPVVGVQSRKDGQQMENMDTYKIQEIVAQVLSQMDNAPAKKQSSGGAIPTKSRAAMLTAHHCF